MNAGAWLRPTIVIASTVALLALVLGDVQSPARTLLTFWFFSACPGLALVPLLRLTDLWSEFTLVVAVSLAAGILVALILIYGGMWYPSLAVVILSAVSLAGALGQLYQTARESNQPQSEPDATYD